MKRVLRRFSLLFLLTTLTGACQQGERSAPRAACTELREHLVDLQLRPVVAARGEAPGVALELEKHRANLIASLGESFVDDCEATRSAAYVECALRAPNAEEIARCGRE